MDNKMIVKFLKTLVVDIITNKSHIIEVTQEAQRYGGYELEDDKIKKTITITYI